MKMKRVYILLVFAFALSSCMKENMEPVAPESSENISFRASLQRAGAPTKSTFDKLVMESETWLVEAEEIEGAQTKAAPTTALAGSVGITAIQYEGEWDETTVYPNTRMKNDEFTVDGDALNPVEPRAWRNIAEGDNIRFFAYAPYNAAQGTLSAMDGSVKGTPYVTWTVKASAAEQQDLLYAASADYSYDTRQTVPLTFNHALCAIQFKAGFACKVKSIAVKNVMTKGRFKATGEWSNLSTKANRTVTVSNSSSGKSIAEGGMITEGSKTMMMIPQHLAAPSSTLNTETDPYIEMVYVKNGDEVHLLAPLGGLAGGDGADWEMGRKITYTIYEEAAPEVEYIYFDLAAGDVVIKDDVYIGKVYVQQSGDPENTCPTRRVIKGVHKSTNKYYVYQSFIEDGTSSGTESGHKYGYYGDVPSGSGYTTNRNFEGSTVTLNLPTYPRVTYNGQPWADFITNNPNVEDVTSKWTTAATAAGRQASPFGIAVAMTTDDPNTNEVDITLDNVWSNYWFVDGEATQDVPGGVTVGFAAYLKNIADGTYTNTATYNVPAVTPNVSTGAGYCFNQQVTLRIKNDVKLNNISYRQPIDDNTYPGYLKITSAEGDGSSEGTLTVTFPATRSKGTKPDGTDGTANSARRSVIGPGAPGSASGSSPNQREVNNLYFNGATVYAGLSKTNNSEWSSASHLWNCVAGSNADGIMYINGGTHTFVSNSTCAAIGGGGGHDETGGKGTVTINGGNVYAYNHGVYSSNSAVLSVTPCTAIGGGSTFGKNSHGQGGVGNVTINGGYVYACSVGGVAIGGGGSARLDGGNGNVTITGGTVVAQSIAGTIGDANPNPIAAGVAIGGGTAGKVAGKNGGDANITITGGNVTTGSVGGGSVMNTELNPTGKIGSADIDISNGTISGQFVMAAGAATAPTFDMTGGTIKSSNTDDNTFYHVSPYGGAVYMEAGTCTISGGTISGCHADKGGAIYMTTSGSESPTFNMTGGTLYKNSSDSDGGAVYVKGGEVSMTGGTIDHNFTIDGNGGGICVNGGSFTMNGPEATTMITANGANIFSDATHAGVGGNGGGLYVSSDTNDPEVNILRGTVTGNTADRNGGGIGVDMPDDASHIAAITIGVDGGTPESPWIRDNSASLSGGGLCVTGRGSNVYIYSGTTQGNVSAYVKNEDIRNDGGMMYLYGTTENASVNYITVTFYACTDPDQDAEQRVVTSTNSLLTPPAAAKAFTRQYHHLIGWNEVRDAGQNDGVFYSVDGVKLYENGVATGETTPAVINRTSNLSLYAVWELN